MYIYIYAHTHTHTHIHMCQAIEFGPTRCWGCQRFFWFHSVGTFGHLWCLARSGGAAPCQGEKDIWSANDCSRRRVFRRQNGRNPHHFHLIPLDEHGRCCSGKMDNSQRTTTCQEDWRAANEVQNRAEMDSRQSCWMKERVATEDWQRWSKKSCSSACSCANWQMVALDTPYRLAASWIETCLTSHVRSARHWIQSGSDLKTLSRPFRHVERQVSCWAAEFRCGKSEKRCHAFCWRGALWTDPTHPWPVSRSNHKLSPNYEMNWHELQKDFRHFRNVLPRMALEMLRLRKERRLGTAVDWEWVVGNWFGSRLLAYQAQRWE